MAAGVDRRDGEEQLSEKKKNPFIGDVFLLKIVLCSADVEAVISGGF